MADSKIASSSSMASASSSVTIVCVLQQILEKLYELSETSETMASKLCIIEMRQSNNQGEINDAIRALHSFALAESACCPKEALQAVCENFKQGGTASYCENFLAKDLRRCEYELVLFHEKVWNFKAEGVGVGEGRGGGCQSHN